MTRRQLPAYSPLTPGALASGVRAMLASGRGRAEKRARALLRDRFGARRVIFTDSGTSALALALRATREARGDQVALPAFSCYDVGTAWKGAGVRPHLYDLVPEMLSPDPTSLRRALEDDVGAVVVAYLYGVPLDWDGMRDAMEGSGALIIEDAAQGRGCRWRGERAGSLGDVSVLSFGRGKGWTAGGGGALLALSERGVETLSGQEPEELRPASSAAALLRSVLQWTFGRPHLYGLPASLPGLRLGETVYHPPSPPAGASTFSLGLLSATEGLLDREAAVRRENARRLLDLVGDADGIRPIRGAGDGTPGFLRLPVLVDDRAAPRLEERGGEVLGAMPSYPRPLYRLPQLRESLRDGASLPLAGSERLARSLYTLPTHSLLRPSDRRALGRLLRDAPAADRPETGRSVPGVPTDLRVFAALSVVSLIAYLGLSQAVRAFVQRAATLLSTLIRVVG